MATVVEHPNASLFRRGYEAFTSGDLDTLRETFSSDIVWHVGGRNRYTGDKRGIDNVLAFFVELTQITDGTFRLDVHDVLAKDEHAVALVNVHWDSIPQTKGGGIELVERITVRPKEVLLELESRLGPNPHFATGRP